MPCRFARWALEVRISPSRLRAVCGFKGRGACTCCWTSWRSTSVSPKRRCQGFWPPRSFPNSTMKQASVVKLTDTGLELQGRFFAERLRRFLEFLRVPMVLRCLKFHVVEAFSGRFR